MPCIRAGLPIMKARTLVMMLGMMIMSFTGFGFTTADLTENSTPEIVQMDVSEIVVIDFDVMEVYSIASDSKSEAVRKLNVILDTQAAPDPQPNHNEKPYSSNLKMIIVDLTEHIIHRQYCNKDPSRFYSSYI